MLYLFISRKQKKNDLKVNYTVLIRLSSIMVRESIDVRERVCSVSFMEFQSVTYY